MGSWSVQDGARVVMHNNLSIFLPGTSNALSRSWQGCFRKDNSKAKSGHLLPSGITDIRVLVAGEAFKSP